MASIQLFPHTAAPSVIVSTCTNALQKAVSSFHLACAPRGSVLYVLAAILHPVSWAGMRGLSLLCGLALLQATVSSSQWSPGSYPNPQTQPARCGRSHVQRSWVCDPDGLLSKRSGDVIEGILKSIAAAEHPYAQARECGGRRLDAGYQVKISCNVIFDGVHA